MIWIKNSHSKLTIIIIIIIIYLKPRDCVQTNEYYWLEIITWNYIIISNLESYNIKQIICIR